MFKKLKSKRGFTIVEVMVAFVIFAIMAAMVSTILQQSLKAKQENVDLEDEITNQEQIYYQKKQDPKDKYDATDSHNISLTFKDKSDAELSPLSVDYSLGDPNADVTTEVGAPDNNIALNYIAANISYKKPQSQPNTTTDPQEGSVHSRLNSTIYGSNGISQIKLYMIKAPDEESNGKNRYYIGMQLESTYGDSGQEIPEYLRSFAQVRLMFPSGTTIQNSGIIYAQKASNGAYTFNKGTSVHGYEAMKTTPSILRIASTSLNLTGENSLLEKITDNVVAGVYVDLSSPLSDTYLNEHGSYDLNKLFGYSDDAKTSNASEGGLAYIFTPYVGKVYNSKGEVINESGKYPNIFAGSQKESDSTPKKDEGNEGTLEETE